MKILVREEDMYNLLIVEDEEQLRQMLCEQFSGEGFNTIPARDGDEAIELWSEYKPDLVVLDIMLPVRSGIEVLKKIRSEDNTPVIMLTARVDEIDKLLGLELGADDYVTKPFSPRELIARVKAVLRRSSNNSSERQIVLQNLRIDLSRYEAFIGDVLLPLTGTEFKILVMLAENSGQVFSRLQLLERIYGDIYAGYERTIDTHINNLRRKLEPLAAAFEIKTVYGVGYKLIEAGNNNG
ncbi:MAG: response regulator transcription factor [Syntrophomonadaceae bacterium]|nr:response regulator transcription factor [Syntrophomonadaceae bacterium]MDD3889701.1 response regulator transcription factor [Syntrophomonadaceae bacterium]